MKQYCIEHWFDKDDLISALEGNFDLTDPEVIADMVMELDDLDMEQIAEAAAEQIGICFSTALQDVNGNESIDRILKACFKQETDVHGDD